MNEANEKYIKILETVKLPKKEFYKLNLIQTETQTTDSKIAGCPYIPVNGDIPKSENGNMYMIAQLNLQDFNDGLFPLKQGILQFWILDDVLYGVDFDDMCGQKNSRVVYYPTIEEHYTKEQILENFPTINQEMEDTPLEDKLPFDVNIKLSPEKDIDTIASFDFNYINLLIETHNNLYPDDKIDDIYDLYEELDHDELEELDMEELEEKEPEHSKVLGYPDFCQDDPRTDYREDYVLLFQLISNSLDDFSMLWGDMGVANWFIKYEDLEKGDFSKVMYNYDCS